MRLLLLDIIVRRSTLTVVLLCVVRFQVSIGWVMTFSPAKPPLHVSSREPAHLLRPWYSDPAICRDRTHVEQLEQQSGDEWISFLQSDASRFVLMSRDGMLHQTTITTTESATAAAKPLYLSARQVNRMLSGADDNGCSDSMEQIATDKNGTHTIFAWVGKYVDTDYFVIRVDRRLDTDHCTELRDGVFLPLREFGDGLAHTVDAGILATAQGRVEFHVSHRFCSQCGSSTTSRRVGASRRCVSCQRTVYPRLDVASIMLITSPCGNYALLGRKSTWPVGRYSTLAGFQEVGETMEECCMRETWEESGVIVDPVSVQFVASQPWPFPQSLMVGFHARAAAVVNSHEEDNDDDNTKRLPIITIDHDEMEDIQWFSRDFVGERLDGGSTALDYTPTKNEAEFHIPGRSSLARLLITRWVNNRS